MPSLHLCFRSRAFENVTRVVFHERDDKSPLRECGPVRFFTSELLTCFPDSAEAVFSGLACDFSGYAHIHDTKSAFVAPQSLTWNEERRRRSETQNKQPGVRRLKRLQLVKHHFMSLFTLHSWLQWPQTLIMRRPLTSSKGFFSGQGHSETLKAF